ncbi:hypothetical protein D915_009775 [Fasciola hepatica]|uniref:POGZ/Z280C-D-like double Zinc finger domain-containing protein n=1 Tax=Fasciola hepatica TaxID=6192 RepID=A0A2H1BV00_FASHE|nr:hypothetical protein D915_009775 [Fasciola hepatica]
MNAPEAGGIMDLDLLRFPENIGEVHCLECGEPMDSDVHKRYLPCSLCRFATCCAVGYNRHVNRVHVYVAGAPQTEPDSGMPMVRPIHFQWIDDEVALLDALNQTDPTPVTVTSQPSARNNNQPVDVVTEENEEPAPSELVTDTDQPKTSPVDLQIDELLHESEQLSTEAAKSTEVAVDQVAEQISEEAAQVLEQKGSPQMEVPIEERSTDNVDVPNKNDESDQSANISASPTETKTQTEVENADNLTRDIDMHANAVVTVPGVLEDQSEPEASQTNPINVTDQPQSIPACDQQSGKPREVDPASVILRYMASLVDARLFACTHCAASAMNGNSLARHMVEECGANTATLSPDPLLVKARQETEEQYRIQKAQEQQEQTEAGILFESTDVNLTGTELSSVVHQSERPNEDVVMMSVDGDQLASYGFAGSEDPTAFGTHLVTQVGPNGTTIDLTNDNGEIVQQFLIPDDLQLDEGQTLVVIQGEDGQPQLAIVNQADLIDPNSQQMVIQTEDGQANNMLLYSSALDGQHHLEEAVIVGQEEEKENHQYALG